MTYPAHIRKKILAELEDSTYRAVAARHSPPQHPRHLEETATTQRQPPFYAPPSHRRTHPAKRRRAPTLMTINKERAARLDCSQNGICKALKRYRITVKKRLPSPQGRRRKTP